ncbi:hypothetical protein SKAU_G00311130 [Synaphobranchus kaupii]|uniref:Uncharacterized protein n=1 Tax=Synaphobranchus kaupii TaxID=118154 RepID=A0A9Q1ERW2_SYNKA|nr:hypothetical protein SKAU_G00311130 [Synaphobranchus kaupii]
MKGVKKKRSANEQHEEEEDHQWTRCPVSHGREVNDTAHVWGRPDMGQNIAVTGTMGPPLGLACSCQCPAVSGGCGSERAERSVAGPSAALGQAPASPRREAP